MQKRTRSLFIVLVLVFAFAGVVMAQGDGNARKGKYLFRKNCRACHVDGGSAKELSPISKTQAQWESVFSKSAELKCAAEWHDCRRPGDNNVLRLRPPDTQPPKLAGARAIRNT